ncbi:M23 family metallopeptidase [Shimia biformata]|uniref:M23 family metallopeptidase n=1 Tax=Shimia biformata TaxID=1294299 RepID=UPI00195232CF|nr:M23 family metallopeptidase [Shimia biformata]
MTSGRYFGLWALILSGCAYTSEGESTHFHPENPHKVDIVMPPNAPSISQQYRYFPEMSEEKQRLGDHLAIDIKAPIGTPVIAAADGRVRASFYEPIFGNQIAVEHGRGPNGKVLITRYVHLDTRISKEGDVVKRGQQVGTLGLTGAAAQFQPHLHFEVREKQADGHELPADPQYFWIEGVGRVTCFEPGKTIPSNPVLFTYPVVCS